MEQANPQTQIIERDLSKLGDRFDRHLEIYAQNGKELAALKSAVESLKYSLDKQETRDKESLTSIATQTKTNSDDISAINVTLGKLMVRVSIIAATASAVASTAGSVVVSQVLGA